MLERLKIWLRPLRYRLTGVTPPPPKPKKPRYAVTVQAVRELSPRLRRITFTGEDLGRFAWNGPAAHIKVILDPAGGPGGRALMRTYTARRYDGARRELDVDFVLHGEGPASSWAAQARPGQTLDIAGPGKAYNIDPAATHYLLLGDDSALPALATLLEALPGSARVTVLLELAHEADRAGLDANHPGLALHCLVRGEDPRQAGEPLLAALRQRDLPPAGDTSRIYVACESGAVRRIRHHLLAERGWPAAQLVTRGYWKLGATDHPDRDYGEDLPA
jgi:NADPH-dependent ferric siderophore reductase